VTTTDDIRPTTGRLEFGSRAPGFLRAMIQMDRAATKSVTMLAWNAVGVATRAWEPGSYQP
jgi:hypothetical protein